MKRVWWGVGVVGVVATTIATLGRAGSPRAGGRADGAEVVRVVRRDIGSTVKATGVIEPRVGAEVRVGSRISGVVRRLYVQIGDTVTKGQLLAALDDHDLMALRDQAAASLQQADINLRFARTDLPRRRRLQAAGAMSPSDLDEMERAAAVVERLVDGARASLAYATAQLAYARIVAPIAGVVASVSTQEGETVAASFASPTFLTLLDPSRLEVRAYVDETDIGRIRLGQKAMFTVDTYGDHEFAGEVTAVYPKAEIRDNVVNYVTVVRFQAPRDRTLRPAMTTTVRIRLESRDNVLALPIRAVRWEGKRAFILTSRNGAIERRWVTTGMRDDAWCEIIDGAREGDEVLLGDVTTTGERDS